MPNLPSFFSSVVTYLNPPIGEHSIYDHVQTIRWYRFLKCIHIKMAWNPNWYDGNWYGKMYLNYHLLMKIAIRGKFIPLIYYQFKSKYIITWYIRSLHCRRRKQMIINTCYLAQGPNMSLLTINRYRKKQIDCIETLEGF